MIGGSSENRSAGGASFFLRRRGVAPDRRGCTVIAATIVFAVYTLLELSSVQRRSSPSARRPSGEVSFPVEQIIIHRRVVNTSAFEETFGDGEQILQLASRAMEKMQRIQQVRTFSTRMSPVPRRSVAGIFVVDESIVARWSCENIARAFHPTLSERSSWAIFVGPFESNCTAPSAFGASGRIVFVHNGVGVYVRGLTKGLKQINSVADSSSIITHVLALQVPTLHSALALWKRVVRAEDSLFARSALQSCVETVSFQQQQRVVRCGYEVLIQMYEVPHYYVVDKDAGLDFSDSRIEAEAPGPTTAFACPRCMLATAEILAAAGDPDGSLAEFDESAVGADTLVNVVDTLGHSIERFNFVLLQVTQRHVADLKSEFGPLLAACRKWLSVALDMYESVRGRTFFHHNSPSRTNIGLFGDDAAAARRHLSLALARLQIITVDAWQRSMAETYRADRSRFDAEATTEFSIRLAFMARSVADRRLWLQLRQEDAELQQKQQPRRVQGLLASRAQSYFDRMFPPQRPVIAWFSLCCLCCGFSNEIVHYIVPLHLRYKLMLIIDSPECFCSGFPLSVQNLINRTSTLPSTYTKYPQSEPVIWISHTTPIHYNQPFLECRPADYLIGRSMFELSSLPFSWRNRTHLVDEIWVPSKFVKSSFVAIGVSPSRLVVMPEAVDTGLYSPTGPLLKLPIEDRPEILHFVATNVQDTASIADNYKFLSVFKWEARKGWDVLCKAYFNSFSRHDKVSLYILTYIFDSNDLDYKHDRDADAVLRWIFRVGERMGLSISQLPHVYVITAALAEVDVAMLYRSADAFVLPTRGEGWGLPLIQAMSTGLPTIGTNYSGNVDFMLPSISYLIRVDGMETILMENTGIEDFEKEKGEIEWASPSIKHTGELMRMVFGDPSSARIVGAAAREHIVKHYSEEAIYTNNLEPRIQHIQKYKMKRRLPRHHHSWRAGC